MVNPHLGDGSIIAGRRRAELNAPFLSSPAVARHAPDHTPTRRDALHRAQVWHVNDVASGILSGKTAAVGHGVFLVGRRSEAKRPAGPRMLRNEDRVAAVVSGVKEGGCR